MLIAERFPELVNLIPIPDSLAGRNVDGEYLYRRGYLNGMLGTGSRAGDISYRVGYDRGRR